MNAADVQQTVLEALAKRLNLDASTIDPDEPLRDLPSMESVVMLQVVVDIEDALEMTIPDDVAFEAVTARELAGVLVDLR
ncbi:acyl carrier protein [Actinomadura sp. KC06]|uniref:acyl carrier protein n=1 Tax=Actinomadura sp. KC06 TaxID=2530369 RepID=UPI0010525325|nr:acyl carrier protein [Actinomadura sp. KC06]TDD34961.1 acyl carrier protein [Actinomadura sp. KC06]